ncbi:APO protein 4 [Carex littledalei]|uniref:APO protein 4 n=1 Tax=Carex littledalei TaxID=544730 RepID=A0A833R6R8_9POAL|nr:APO protein 4 [Carex littledalei]
MKQQHLFESFLNLSFSFSFMQKQERYYASKINWKELRPVILKRVRNSTNDYPIRRMVPVAEGVIRARHALIQGVSALLQVIPVKSCEFCPEIYVAETGHLMKTCPGFKQLLKNQPHKWIDGQLKDILVPVQTYHLTDNRFDFTRIPAVLELCYQAGADLPQNPNALERMHNFSLPEIIENRERIANLTLEAWERLRSGVRKLLLVYNAKVCQHCCEVHVGPTGHEVRTCGMYEHEDEAMRGDHMWRCVKVDDIMPQNIVWHRRPQDPVVLEDRGRGFYGHAPAVIEICAQAGARVPEKYFCMMKVHGLAPKM